MPLAKELAVFYETVMYDFGKLGEILRRQADFYEKIMTELRPEPEYFRVGFYGLGFPLFVRNKEFVYRGLAYERIGEFTARLSKEFSEATVLTKNTPPEASVLQGEGQAIQICSVRPIPEPSSYDGPNVPDKVRSFYAVNNVCRFVYDRPVHRGGPRNHYVGRNPWGEINGEKPFKWRETFRLVPVEVFVLLAL